MNILFFLTPKIDVEYLYDDYTIRQALEKTEHHGYTAIPVINRNGEYVATVTDGDLLRAVRNYSSEQLEKIKLKELAHHKINHTVGINDQMENLLQLAVNQNFVPVINDDNIFIGIVTRKAIMQYCYDKLKNAPV